MLNHPEPWTKSEWREYDERFGKRLEAWLDAGYGSCVLALPDIRQVVRDCLLRFNGDRFCLHAGVIMPNHAHLILEPFEEHPLSDLLQGIKGASSHGVNRVLGRSGTLWMDESYDHIVRSQAQYNYFIRYIAENPIKSRLSADKFWLFRGATGEKGYDTFLDT